MPIIYVTRIGLIEATVKYELRRLNTNGNKWKMRKYKKCRIICRRAGSIGSLSRKFHLLYKIHKISMGKFFQFSKMDKKNVQN